MDELAEAETIDDLAVYEIYGGDGDGATMVLMFNGSLISVSISPSNGSSTENTRHLGKDRPLQDHLVDIISRATTCQDDDEYEELVDEALLVILNAGRHLFPRPISSQEAPTQSSRSLHHLLFPPVLYFRLEAPASADCVSTIPISSSEANIIDTIDPALDRGSEEDLEVLQDLPRYTPEEVFVTDVFGRGSRSVTAAVQVQGRYMFCKSRGEPGGVFGTCERRELDCLGKMLQVFREPTAIRIPQLVAYIHHKDTKQILGFLRKWVPGRRLSEITSATADTREKWASQIRETIESLHKHGLVWGDAKPSNVVIGDQDDAWLIDFGGGYTQGWVDEELMETKEGDEQALSKIIAYLGKENLAAAKG
ncbi:hypothetical protein IL306_008767 [Fusarium sp. DS 682]|nr:hypothetical protein IL306_008767 [Fusarium sp. DS 682]